MVGIGRGALAEAEARHRISNPWGPDRGIKIIPK
jgi:hypothetical protein